VISSQSMIIRIFPVFVAVAASLGAAQVEPVSKSEARQAIAVLEKSVLSAEASAAAATITRFADESEEVLIVVGPETMPWVQDPAGPDANIRELLTAAYVAGDVKAQLAKKRPDDDPYSGWLFVIKAYKEIHSKRPRVTIPEVEELMAKDKDGTLKKEADTLLVTTGFRPLASISRRRRGSAGRVFLLRLHLRPAQCGQLRRGKHSLRLRIDGIGVHGGKIDFALSVARVVRDDFCQLVRLRHRERCVGVEKRARQLRGHRTAGSRVVVVLKRLDRSVAKIATYRCQPLIGVLLRCRFSHLL
jgi:hypothetical protein